jgi:DNA-directed RNA polymerase subunit alpha
VLAVFGFDEFWGRHDSALRLICYILWERRQLARRQLARNKCQRGSMIWFRKRDPGQSADQAWQQQIHFWEGTPMAKTRIRVSEIEENRKKLIEKLDLSTAEIGLTVRTTNCLEEKGIFNVRDLLNTSRAELLSISNFGEKTLDEVYKSLDTIGFSRPNRDVKPR